MHKNQAIDLSFSEICESVMCSIGLGDGLSRAETCSRGF